jgi:hypothetical protein
MIRGLEKNAYAAIDYRFWVPWLGTAAFLAGVVWPFVGVFAAVGPERWCYASIIAVMLALGCHQPRHTGGRWWHGLFLPVGLAVLHYAVLRAVLLTQLRGGITWRGTFYALRDLRRNRV